jgi:membrane-anchored protein YejM (alkaline phosphatase superfamily)
MERQQIMEEGVTSGMIGALAIAAWFFVLDLAAGSILATPTMLGTSMATLVGQSPSTPAAVITYTLFHFAIFLAIGFVCAWVVNNSEKTPSVLIGFMGLVVAFEVGWIGWTTVLADRTNFGALAWYQVLVANLLAAGAMGVYFWRRHPALGARLNEAIVGQE